MRRTWRWTVFLLTIGLVGNLPAFAGPRDEGLIVLRGPGNSFIDITLEDSVRIRFPDDGQSHFEASSNGGFVGYAVQRLKDKKVLVGGVWVKELDLLGGRIPVRVAFDSVANLRPGRYRFVLLAPEESFFGRPGEASVAIPVEGMEGTKNFSLHRRAAVDWDLYDFRLIPGQTTAVLRDQFEIRSSSTSLVAGSQESDFGQLNYATACFTSPGTVCEQTNGGLDSSYIWVTPGATRSGQSVSAVYGAGDLQPGTHEAHVRMAAAGLGSKLSAFVLILN